MIFKDFSKFLSLFLNRLPSSNQSVLKDSKVIQFYKEIITDPITARNSLIVESHYNFLIKTPALSDYDRILIQKLGPDPKIAINEAPHLFLLTLEANKLLFKPPAHSILNSKYHKCGDLVDFDGIKIIKRVECKTHKSLTKFNAADLVSQYKLATNVSEIKFNIIYATHSISQSEFCNTLYKNSNKQIIPSQVRFFAIDELKEKCTNLNFNRFFSFYQEVGWNDYQSTLSQLNSLLLNEAKFYSTEKSVQRVIDRLIEKGLNSDRERIDPVSIKFFKLKSKRVLKREEDGSSCSPESSALISDEGGDF